MKYKQALGILWKDRCKVTVREYIVNPDNGQDELQERVLFEDEPCRLSYKAVAANADTEEAAALKQTIKLFISSDIEVPAGSKIEITRNNKALAFTASGEPALYTNHQEITLDLFKEWA